MSTLKASVIVAVYNGEKTLGLTIDSLLAQTYPNLEILLIDDGSTDGSKALIETYLHDPRVKYHAKQNGGVASARNYGISVAEGDVIGFCDQDDQWKPEKLEYQLPAFDNPETGLVYSWVEVRKHGEVSVSKPEFEGQCFEALLKRNFISCCTAMARKSLFLEIGGFDESRELHGVDDRHVWLRMARVSNLAVIKRPLAIYFIHGENYSLNEKKMLIADLVCVRKIAAMDGVSGQEKALCKQAEYGIYLHYANNLLYQNHPQDAGHCYLNAWKVKPGQVKYLISGLLLSVTPPPLLRTLKSFRKRVV